LELIDSSRKREALTISCPDRHTVLRRCTAGLDKNRENNPMQSRVNPGSQHCLLRCVWAREEKCAVVMAPT